MLTRKTMKGLDFVYTNCCFFCCLPLDWNKNTQRFEPTKYKIKIGLNYLMAFGMPALMIFSGISFIIDILQHGLPIEEIIVNFLLILVGSAAALLVLGMHLYADEMQINMNNVFILDKYLQDALLTNEEQEKYENKKSLTNTLLNFIEPISIVHSIFAGLLFFEEYDPFRRYYYIYFEKFFGFYSIWHQIPFIIAYTCYIRLSYGIFLAMSITLCTYLESTIFWVEQFSINNKILAQPLKMSIKFYSIVLLMNIQLNNSQLIKILTPTLFSCSFGIIVLCNYCTVRLYTSMNIWSYLLMPSLSIIVFVTFIAWLLKSSELELLSLHYVNVWTHKGRHKYQHVKRLLRTCQPLTLKASNVVALDRGTLLRTFLHIVDKTIGLILLK